MDIVILTAWYVDENGFLYFYFQVSNPNPSKLEIFRNNKSNLVIIALYKLES